MKRISLLLFLSIVLLNFSSCSKSEGQPVEASLKFIMGASATSYFSGGAMLYGRRHRGGQFAFDISNASSDLILDLRKGLWDFHVIGWEGPDAMTGKVRCGKLENQNLNSRRKDLAFNINNSNCMDPAFSPHHKIISSEVKLPDISIHSCRDISTIDVSGPVPSNTCGLLGQKSGVQSFRVRLQTFVEGDVGRIQAQPSPGHDILSDCYQVPAGLDPQAISTVGLMVNMPSGNGVVPFKTIVEGFLQSNCDGSGGVHTTEFEKGIYSANGLFVDARAKTHIDNNIAAVFLNIRDHEVCSSYNKFGPHVFAGGDGTSENPYGLCHPSQFNSVGSNSPYLAASYRLLSDLDFMQTMGGLGLPDAAPCMELGRNTIPFGGMHTDSVNCTGDIQTTPIAFTGKFYGAGRVMKNILIEKDNFDKLGIFRKLGSVGEVKDLKIENTEVRGREVLGGLVGESEGTINNVQMKRISVKSEGALSISADIGGLVGKQVSGNISQSFVENGKIEASDEAVGGLIGNQNAAGTLSYSYFTGVVSGNTSSSGSGQYVGGIVGITFGSISFAFSEGVVISSANYLGGIAGVASTGSDVHDVYSGMAVSSLADPSNINVGVGGLIGKHMSSNGLNKGIFTGVITRSCSVNDTTCYIGEIIGKETGTTSSNVKSIRSVGATGLNLGSDRGAFLYQINFKDPASNIVSSWTAWVHQFGDYPRFAFDSRECSTTSNLQSVATQFGSGRGIASNPIKLCHRDQFSDIASYPSLYYKMINPINLRLDNPSDEYSVTNLPNFSGQFDGQGYPLIGYNPDVSGSNISLFDAVDAGAKIEKLLMISPQMIGGAGKNNLAFLTRVNDGQLSGIRILAGKLTGDDNAGMITVTNNGIIENSEVSGEIWGDFYIGGIASTNNKHIFKTSSKINFHYYEMTPNAVAIGGLVAMNSSLGIVKESEFDGRIEIIKSPGTIAGGIVAQNQGLVEDVLFGKHALVRVAGGDDVGGIVGSNEVSASINRALSLGSVVYDGFCAVRTHDNNSSCTANPSSWTVPVEAEYGAIAGANSGSILESFYKVKPMEEETPDFASISGQPIFNTTTDLCEITLAGAFSPTSNFSPSTYALITSSSMDFDKSYTITNSGSGTSLIMDMSKNECEDTSLNGASIQKLRIGTNSTGSQRSVSSLGKRVNYNASWDMIEENPNAPGFDRLLDSHFASILGQPRPANAPIWNLEQGRFPRLGVNK